ncbi:ComEC/Rec2 family competence protein [Aurantimonas sp. C2-6-R+9]|uniref:ComEC/Rec2 family competence protein n=1 Tax=unclassified Aurantimonas TaxID=2638230 RepID=UPI002E16DC03|nr:MULTISPECIES: ComEC/Rec2 family competence protein [unclassified Aurantimonas]MEC5292145.1 ComEC/Rec2 family competence protein [Aurantimonas sp. C2-3-R2]MEC5382295.1 ComEC/Rec2 family competence protein [Aurantimonas sp. C2-6-R+9]MEC5413231.1 ComEC/Rec2 family competence protein [Aurantimonas sp. C2-4-R8]
MDTAADRNDSANEQKGQRARAGGSRAWRGFRPPPRPEWGAITAGWLTAQLEAETRHRSGFHLIAIGLMVGVAVVYGIGWRPGLAVAAIASTVLLALAFLVPGRPVLRPSLVCAGFVLAGAVLAMTEIERTDTTLFSGEATVRIAGTVVSRERTDNGRYRYVIDIASTDRPVLSRPPERVRVVVGSRHALIPPGGDFRGLVRLRPPSGPAFPGSHDFAFAPFFSGIGAYGFSLGAPEPPASDIFGSAARKGLGAWLRHRLSATRLAMTERISQIIGGAEGGIAAALVTGERTGIPDEAEEWLRGTGLAHVLSISGLHMAIVAGFAMLLVRTVFALVPAIALRFPIKKIAAVAALVVAAFYLALSGANIATQRAFIMLAIMLTAVLLDRPALTLRNVSIAAIVVIALTPHAVMTASFQMSFAATVALIGGYAALSRRRARSSVPPGSRGWVHRILLAFAAIAMTSLIAGTATAPYSAYHFHRLATFGLVANVLTMPLFTLWIMPLALIGSLVMPFGLDAWAFQAMGYGIGLVLQIARFVYERLPDQAIGLTTATGLVLLTAAILAASCLASRLRYVAIPLVLAGLAAAPDRVAPPELLIFEDGKEVALVAEDGQLAFLRERPNDFIAAQWERAFEARGRPSADREPRRRISADCDEALCRFETRDGLKVVWTDDYEKTGVACDSGDVAIVARAIRLSACRSGAILVTLRTLRRTGSLAIRRDALSGRPIVDRAIADPPAEWNRHRLAPWPEYWRKPAVETPATAARRQDEAVETVNDAASSTAANPTVGLRENPRPKAAGEPN